MNNKIVKGMLFNFCMIFGLSMSFIVSAVSDNIDINYTICPSDPDWGKMSYQEQLAAVDFSESELEKLDTLRLIELAVDYPFNIDIMAFDDRSKGLKHLEDTSAVYRVLLRRKDLKYNLQKVLSDIDENDYVKLMTIKTIIGCKCPELIEKDSKKETVVRNDINIFQRMSLLSDGFIPGGNGVQLCFDQPNCTDYAFYTGGVYHKYGKNASCYKYTSGDYTSVEKNILNSSFSNAHSNWVYKSTATKKYNCHSFSWIERSYSNQYWFNDPFAFLTATPYVVPSLPNGPVTLGQRVTIHNSEGLQHSAIATASSWGSSPLLYKSTSKVESKFGTLGVYETSLQDTFIFYTGLYYVTYDVSY